MLGSLHSVTTGDWPCLLDQYGQREYWVERPGWFLM